MFSSSPHTAFVSTHQGVMAHAIVKEFDDLWNNEAAKDYDEISVFYRKQYNRKKQIDELIKSQHIIALENEIVDFDTYQL